MITKNIYGEKRNFLCGEMPSKEVSELADNFQEIISQHNRLKEAYSRGVDDMAEAVKEVLEEELSKARLEGFKLGFRDGVKSVTEVSLREVVGMPHFENNLCEDINVDVDSLQAGNWIESFLQCLRESDSDKGYTYMGTNNFCPPNMLEELVVQEEELEELEEVEEVVEEPKQERKHSHYFKDVSKFDEIDTYLLARIWGIEDENGALFHALKKMLDAGKRGGGKGKLKDISEARDSLNRYLEIEESFKRD
jgi:hypothetical protein